MKILTNFKFWFNAGNLEFQKMFWLVINPNGPADGALHCKMMPKAGSYPYLVNYAGVRTWGKLHTQL